MGFRNVVLSLCFLGLFFSCNKKNVEGNVNDTTDVVENSLSQDAQNLTNDKGETLVVTYFAEGNDVAMKLKKNNEEEHKLIAKGTNDKGEPIFTDGFYAWELSDDGHSGRLTDKQGNVSVFK